MKRKIPMISKSGRYPEYETAGAAGMDLKAYLDEPFELMPGERTLVPTGLFAAVPDDCEIQIRARSGLAIRYGIGLVNGVGTVDSDYRGEIMVPLINFGKEPFFIHDGDRIAQMVVSSVERVDILPVDELDDTYRGAGGFGSTGK